MSQKKFQTSYPYTGTMQEFYYLAIPHAVCYGFEILTQCESPCHPFLIFKTRFLQPPGMTINNACMQSASILNA